MTDDLLARLRKVDPDTPGERTRWYRNPDGPEAADRIEQLEALIALIEDLDPNVMDEARAALEGKDD